MPIDHIELAGYRCVFWAPEEAGQAAPETLNSKGQAVAKDAVNNIAKNVSKGVIKEFAKNARQAKGQEACRDGAFAAMSVDATAPGQALSLVVCCNGGQQDLIEQLAAGRPNCYLLAPEAVWERDYTPWPAPALAGRGPFSGGGPAFLEGLEQRLLPLVAQRYALALRPERTAVMGYSLGGLFALWAFCRSNLFGTALCLSGSFWYEGWLEFLQKQRLAAKGRVYLSLGKKEEQNGPAPLRRVGACTRDTASLLQQQLGEDAVTLEWNPGGHFTDVSGRWRKALTWLTLR